MLSGSHGSHPWVGPRSDRRHGGALESSARRDAAPVPWPRHSVLQSTAMPVADYKTYCAMLERARAERFAFPAVNVTSLTTANAVLRGLAESKADGIIQVSTGGGAFASGSALKDSALGAIAIAEHVHRAAERYPIFVA